jgi:hypothetical protein
LTLSPTPSPFPDLSTPDFAVWPQPWHVSRGPLSIRLKTYLPGEVSAALYNIAFEKVADLVRFTSDGSPQSCVFTWSGGAAVSGGIYLLVIENNGQRKLFKIAIVR